MTIKPIALLAIAGALALGGCSGGSDDPAAPVSNVENMTPIEVTNTATVPTEAPPATQIDNVAATPPETVPTTLSADDQTQDDADATGMTARVSRDDGSNEAQPAQ